jgi:hypothetical protein
MAREQKLGPVPTKGAPMFGDSVQH